MGMLITSLLCLIIEIVISLWWLQELLLDGQGHCKNICSSHHFLPCAGSREAPENAAETKLHGNKHAAREQP